MEKTLERKALMTSQQLDKSARTEELVDLENRYGANNYHPLDVVIERAEGVWVYDVEGKRYLDCLAAYSAVNQGHCHPKILQTLYEQAAKESDVPQSLAAHVQIANAYFALGKPDEARKASERARARTR